MSQSVFGYNKLSEQASSPTVTTGLGMTYFKDDGNLYCQNDAGEEVQITSGDSLNTSGSSGAGVNEYIWTPSQMEAGGSRDSLTFATNFSMLGYPLPDSVTTELNTECVRIPGGIITEIGNGNDLKLEFAMLGDGASGDVRISPRLLLIDQSAGTTSEEQISASTQSVDSTSLTIVAAELTNITLEAGDSAIVRFDREGGQGVDTLAADLLLTWIRMSTVESGS